jgi:tRNA pseudouridine38-40 synthase
LKSSKSLNSWKGFSDFDDFNDLSASRMRNIKLIIEYDGTDYHGWQVQPGLKTIQGVLQSKLSMITKTDVAVSGAGRTDAGVHALAQVANFKTRSRMTPEEFKAALNSVLPKDIVIKNTQQVKDNFHARYSATGRTYRYTILSDITPSAFLRDYTYLVSGPIDVGSMADACSSLLGTHDFSSFASTGDPVQSFTRTVSDARVLDTGCPLVDTEYSILDAQYWMLVRDAKRRLIHFWIEANAFLRGMVRAIAGTLLEIGKGKMPPEKMRDILEAKDRSAAGTGLPARGLCLIKVDYGSCIR